MLFDVPDQTVLAYCVPTPWNNANIVYPDKRKTVFKIQKSLARIQLDTTLWYWDLSGLAWYLNESQETSQRKINYQIIMIGCNN